MHSIRIEYCVPCGYRDRAIDVLRAILNGLERDLDEVTLVMGSHGVFRVTVDGETVYDKDEQDYDVDEIVRTVRKQL